MAEAIKNDEILSEDQLDAVAGGTVIQTNHDKNLFRVMGETNTNLVANFAKYGVGFIADNKSDNSYFFQGESISQNCAHKIVRLQSMGCTDIRIFHNPQNGDVVIDAASPDGGRVIYDF